MNKHHQDSTSLEEKLIRSGGFNPDDLAFNQVGELSPRQKRWLMIEVAAWGFQIGLELVLIVCAWLFYYLQFRHNLWVFVMGGLFWSGILGISALTCLELHVQPLWADIQGNEVKSISGAVSKYYGFGKSQYAKQFKNMRGVNWGVEIRGQGFSVYPQVYAALVAHQSYRLFYLPDTERIINIEPLFQAHAEKQSALAALQERARGDGAEQ